jgi:hypothetical protein
MIAILDPWQANPGSVGEAMPVGCANSVARRIRRICRKIE